MEVASIRGIHMFYEVRILNRKGKIKKVFSSRELGKTHWEGFDIHSHGHRSVSSNKNKGRKGARKQKMAHREVVEKWD